MSVNTIEVNISNVEESIDKLCTLKSKWEEEKLTRPDKDATESMGSCIDALNFLVDKYESYDTTAINLLDSTISFLTKAKEKMQQADEGC